MKLEQRTLRQIKCIKEIMVANWKKQRTPKGCDNGSGKKVFFLLESESAKSLAELGRETQ